ncbi:MAG TPA: enediyne biosynthesis protein UnbU [Blastocatellia bacterium]|jgi:Na+-translocating ferredoxin:NAD+ oxidoreductase RnfD subunit|nr:enediyne biosynthesis protein UnbU [Blastocatellia bacterium]
MSLESNWEGRRRLGGLRRFAVAITVLNILGHTVLGFEQSLAQPLVAMATAYSLEIMLELIDAWASNRPLKFSGGVRNFIDFLLSAHISALAVSMLLYANDQLWVVAFAAAVAITSKLIFRAPAGSGTRHFFNPSNFGITITLLLFSWVGIAPPYQFTEKLGAAGDWILPGIIIVSGTFLNARFTRKLPLIAAWLGGFILQAAIRSMMMGTPIGAALGPMTGVAFILFTFYMVTDPATSPGNYKGQILFGAAVACAYGVLVAAHVVFGLFFGLTLVCLIRGLAFYALHAIAARRARASDKVEAVVAAVSEV